MKKLWKWLTVTIVGLIGLIFYFLNKKNKEIESLKTKAKLTNTQKQADALETEIKQKQIQKELLAKEKEELAKAMEELELKKKKIKTKAATMTDANEIAKYWEDN